MLTAILAEPADTQTLAFAEELRELLADIRANGEAKLEAAV